MIWLTWRQFRVQLAAGAVFIVGFALLMALTGPGLADDWADGLAVCTPANTCDQYANDFFQDHQRFYNIIIIALLALPALIGIFWGAPLISRELEAGTHRLAWNQSVTRTRWLTVKLALIGLAAAVAAGLAGLAVTWWSTTLDDAAALGGHQGKMTSVIFAARGIAPIGYALFAFALGVTLGVVLRRALPAMALVLVAFVAMTQFVMPLWVREHLASPVHETVPITDANFDGLSLTPDGVQLQLKTPDTGAWQLTNATVDTSGNAIGPLPSSISEGDGPCSMKVDKAQVPPNTTVTQRPKIAQSCLDAINKLGYRQELKYFPESRFWALQWRETAVFVGLAGALSGFCFWWVRRRIT